MGKTVRRIHCMAVWLTVIVQIMASVILIHLMSFSSHAHTSSPNMKIDPVDLQTMAMNPITTNRRAIDFLIRSPLNAKTFSDPYLARQLHDSRARSMLRYLYSCAAPQGSKLTISDPFTHLQYQFWGGLGLCPSWVQERGSASQECQELVSACILARSNLFGVSVPMSLKGVANGSSFQFSSVVPYHKVKRTNIDVKSVVPCLVPLAGVSRNCGWNVEYVGSCTPGTTVSVGMGCSGGTSSGDMMLRICAGIRACDYSTVLGTNNDSCGRAPRVVFTCPTVGYFSVMKAPYSSTDVTSRGSAGAVYATYPLNANAIFPYREGAFYGNMLGASNISPLVRDVEVGTDGVTRGAEQRIANSNPVFPHLYFCIYPGWQLPYAYYIPKRLCAGGTTNCLVRCAGFCDNVDTTAGLCASQSGYYTQCKGPDGTPCYRPITLFFNDKCDGIKPDDVCQ